MRCPWTRRKRSGALLRRSVRAQAFCSALFVEAKRWTGALWWRSSLSSVAGKRTEQGVAQILADGESCMAVAWRERDRQ